MTPLKPEELQQFLSVAASWYPTDIEVDEPDTDDGVWFISFRSISVSYQKNSGFCVWISTGEGYGEKPDVITKDYKEASDLVRQAVFSHLDGQNLGDRE